MISCLASAGFGLGFWGSSRSGLWQALTIVIAFLSVSLVAFIWAAFFPRQGRPHRQHHHSHQPPEPPPQNNGQAAAHDEKKNSSGSRRRRLRRREHRPRNPTLAEAGGLPPVRPDDVRPPGL